MKIGIISRILKEDLAKSGALPGWVDSLVQPLNEFISQVGLALKGGLTFSDNFACKQISLSMTHAVEISVNPQSTRKVIGMIPLSTLKQRIDCYGFQLKSNGQIGVTFKFDGGTSTTKDTVTFLLLYG